MEELAASLLAEAAAKDSRTGARALRPLVSELLNPFEFDPEDGDVLEPLDSGRRRLRITADMARRSLA